MEIPFFKKILLELLYNVDQILLYSKVNQLHGYPLFFGISFTFRSPQSTESCYLCYTIGSHQLSILYIISVSYIIPDQYSASIPTSQSIPCPLTSLVSRFCSLHLCLSFCFANKFIYTIFLDSTYMHKYMIFVFLFLTYFILRDHLQFHLTSLQMT